MSHQSISITFKSPFFSTISFFILFLLLFLANTFISKLSLSYVRYIENEDDRDPCTCGSAAIDKIQPHSKMTRTHRKSNKDIIKWLNSMNLNGIREFEFEYRVKEFLSHDCITQFFMIWISPTCLFKRRAFLAMESIFNSHPRGCLLILSKSMDTKCGSQILKPITDNGYKVLAVEPNLSFLFNNTPAKTWLNAIRTGSKDPGKIPLAQNLSNLMRLAVLYKYGGVYIDSDFIVLRDFSNLRNAMGAQGMDESGKWTRLNNAVLVFDKNHKLVYKFMEEFANNFNGNIWGFNGPYLVSRVIEREQNKRENMKLMILPPRVVYPVNWIDVRGYFEKPRNETHLKWMEEELSELNGGGGGAYGVHLWNSKSGKMKIEQGSILHTLISTHCIICQSIA